jgi:hypothetical protein
MFHTKPTRIFVNRLKSEFNVDADDDMRLVIITFCSRRTSKFTLYMNEFSGCNNNIT